MLKRDKERVVAELVERLRASDTLIVADYRGLTMSEIDGVRTELLKHGARFSVVKNTLTKRAAEEAGVNSLVELLEGPTAIAFVLEGDMVAVAKSLNDTARQTKVLTLKGGILQGQPVGADEMVRLASLPSANVLQGQVLGAVVGPLNAIAVGPSSRASSASAPAASAALRVSVFLTTEKRAPTSSSLPRNASISAFVRPR